MHLHQALTNSKPGVYNISSLFNTLHTNPEFSGHVILGVKYV